MKDSISKITSLGCLNAKEILDERIGLQKKLCTPIYLKSKGNLLNRSTTRNKARLLSLSGDHAGAWLLAIPNPSMGLCFNSTEFRVLLRHMLGLPLYSISRTCPACNKTLLDIYGDHSLICGAESERSNRHTYVRDTLYHIMKSAGLSPSLETANLIPGTIRRPGDVSVTNWSLGKSAAIDVSITSPLQNTTILSAAIEAGFAAGEREKSKDENNLKKLS